MRWNAHQHHRAILISPCVYPPKWSSEGSLKCHEAGRSHPPGALERHPRTVIRLWAGVQGWILRPTAMRAALSWRRSWLAPAISPMPEPVPHAMRSGAPAIRSSQLYLLGQQWHISGRGLSLPSTAATTAAANSPSTVEAAYIDHRHRRAPRDDQSVAWSAWTKITTTTPR